MMYRSTLSIESDRFDLLDTLDLCTTPQAPCNSMKLVFIRGPGAIVPNMLHKNSRIPFPCPRFSLPARHAIGYPNSRDLVLRRTLLGSRYPGHTQRVVFKIRCCRSLYSTKCQFLLLHIARIPSNSESLASLPHSFGTSTLSALLWHSRSKPYSPTQCYSMHSSSVLRLSTP